MHPLQKKMLTSLKDLVTKTAAVKVAAPVLWKYSDPEGNDFYLEEKKTTVKSPFSGKSFSVRPERFTPAQVGQEMKEEAMEKQAAVASAMHDQTWAWTTQAMDELKRIAKEAHAASLKVSTLQEKVQMKNIEKRAIQGLHAVSLVFGDSKV